MKKQIILLVASALVLGSFLGSAPAFAGYQPGFNFVIAPIVFHPRVYSHHFDRGYVYNQYPVRTVKTVGIVNRYSSDENHEVTYVKHIEPVRINKFRGGHRHYQNW